MTWLLLMLATKWIREAIRCGSYSTYDMTHHKPASGVARAGLSFTESSQLRASLSNTPLALLEDAVHGKNNY